MSNPIDHLGDVDAALDLVHEAARRYIASLPERPVRPPSAELMAPPWAGCCLRMGWGRSRRWGS